MASEDQPTDLRQRVRQLVTDALEQDDPCRWFEPLYREAQGDVDQVPWAGRAPHRLLQEWLSQQPTLDGVAIVIGCGLGDDAEALQQHGLQVTAFDISPTAIAWCRQRFPGSEVDYQVAVLLALPDAWRHRFDLVFECRNIQALPLSLRNRAIAAVASLVAPHGTLLVVTHLRDQHEVEPDGPPWPLSEKELAGFETLGLVEGDRQLHQEMASPVRQVRVEYRQGIPSPIHDAE